MAQDQCSSLKQQLQDAKQAAQKQLAAAQGETQVAQDQCSSLKQQITLMEDGIRSLQSKLHEADAHLREATARAERGESRVQQLKQAQLFERQQAAPAASVADRVQHPWEANTQKSVPADHVGYTATGKCFHRNGCRFWKQCVGFMPLAKAQSEAKYRPCKFCCRYM